jgi:transcription-repair coupling factor (superfamily II helicase)
VDPSRLMKLVAKNAKRGAQFTPQGVLRFPIAAVKPEEVLAAVQGLLGELADSSVQRPAVSVQ